MDDIDIHCIRILGFGGGARGEGLVQVLDGALVSPRDFLCSLPLSLKVDGFGVPFLDSSGYGVHGHDSSHKERGYSSREVPNEDI